VLDRTINGVDPNPAGANYPSDGAGRLTGWFERDAAAGVNAQGALVVIRLRNRPLTCFAFVAILGLYRALIFSPIGLLMLAWGGPVGGVIFAASMVIFCLLATRARVVVNADSIRVTNVVTREFRRECSELVAVRPIFGSRLLVLGLKAHGSEKALPIWAIAGISGRERSKIAEALPIRFADGERGMYLA
jgi:hypothetical protein